MDILGHDSNDSALMGDRGCNFHGIYIIISVDIGLLNFEMTKPFKDLVIEQMAML